MIKVYENLAEVVNIPYYMQKSVPSLEDFVSNALMHAYYFCEMKWPKRMLVICRDTDDGSILQRCLVYPLLPHPALTANLISEITPELLRRYILETPSITAVVSSEPVLVNDLTFPVVLVFGRENELEYYKRFCTKDGILMDYGDNALEDAEIKFQQMRAKNWKFNNAIIEAMEAFSKV